MGYPKLPETVLPGSSAGSFRRKFFLASFLGKQRSWRALWPKATQQDSDVDLECSRLKAEPTSVTNDSRSEARIWNEKLKIRWQKKDLDAPDL